MSHHPAARIDRDLPEHWRGRAARWVHDTAGAVTIDWVVLSAVILALGVGIITLMADTVNGVGVATASKLSDATMKDISFD